ncbi:unnamed protein product [Brachionus calyciflorus]|uniref:Ubiquitin-like protease family profile domain-containing protein n=1 Tax=Brachionus calyciflorus TaxID=104777 RepID=A0A814GF54_9BILA|nr:unnamed protein product [Brachionus calyciflorus]
MVNNVKKRTRSEQYPIKQIYPSEINKLITESKDLESIYEKVPKYDSVKNGFYKVRREEMPRLPKEISEISLNLDRFCITSYSKEFLLFDTLGTDRIIAFASKIQLEILSKPTKWHIDGTFKSCPNLYYQLYTIHAWLDEEMFCCAYILLLGKNNSIYKKAFENFKDASNKLGFSLKPDQIMSDYEPAAINASKQVFQSSARGCYFHYIQCVWKNITSNHLTKEYKCNEQTKRWFNKLKALAFLPPNYVKLGYNYLKSIKPDSENLKNIDNFLKYFESTWIDGRYTIEIWNHFNNYGPRTNNHVEAHNRNINNELLIKHPNIYQFVDFIKLVETELYRDGPNSVKTWVKENIFLYELAFLPININSNHWILCAIESLKCKVTIYDSYLEEYDKLLKNINEFLNFEYSKYYGINLTSHWSISNRNDLPVQ